MRSSSLLWRLESLDAPGEAWLFGTMHVRDKAAFTHLERAMRALEACEAFAAEFNLDEAPESGLEAQLLLPEGQSLATLLKPRRYAKVRKSLQKYAGIDPDLVPRYTPFAWLSLIDSTHFAQDHALPLDEHLWLHAREAGKQIYGLESFAAQIDIIQRIPLDQQCRALVAWASRPATHRRHLERLTQAYQLGDIHRLYHASKRSLGGLRKLLLYDRNRLMATRIHELAQQQTLFVAVGASHLAGGKGIIRLLKGMGWRVLPPFLDNTSNAPGAV